MGLKISCFLLNRVALPIIYRCQKHDKVKKLVSLVSDCIYLNHPTVLYIRWQFHVVLSEIEGVEPWESRDAWEKCVGRYKYDTFYVIDRILSEKDFIDNIITVLEHEVRGLKGTRGLNE